MELTRWVRQVLEEGIRLDPSLSDHLEATFGSNDLSAVLADATSSESASFLELLFFPDSDIRLDFEYRFGDHLFSDGDEVDLVKSLVRSAVTAAIRVPGESPPLNFQVPDFVLAAFVQRLNMTWQPTALLCAMLARVDAPESLPPVRARLRQLRLLWHPVQIVLVEQFIVRFPPSEEDFEVCFAFLTSILAEIEPDEKPFAFLVAKKSFYFQALCKAERFERLRQTSNMETLMLQGARVAHGSIAQWREQMRLTDRLCQMLYGKTRFFQQPAELTLGAADQPADRQMSELVRMLS